MGGMFTYHIRKFVPRHAVHHVREHDPQHNVTVFRGKWHDFIDHAAFDDFYGLRVDY